ncbi:hypothetical protein GCG54_00010563 [Colletotrichum gloeosporioides]|uniref:Heterokaryon incompatibility domain-containing protein n=1 Tax=Colletotrichum gloeosporioides TaxID=474922 RepID=A0A8H4FDU3_COLGL|nr:uncharacterized protein GCG54_00010563 [Colletotrichum gloeosporioides]KAF3798215.1 hypothetical protein GCG54_00010563 [Colletotrichum gloeosporioides]
MLWAIAEYFQEKSCATLPTRLLDLQCPDGKIHLVEPAPGSSGIYATLSYRWGARRDHLTTKDTLSQHIQEVPAGHLPRVFQDAIELCRCLDVQYLWIDSLCIIQDDTEDWERESSLMGSIYTHSIFTIAAHTAGSDEEGFLHNYNPLFHVIRRDGSGQLWKIALSRGFEAEMTSNSSISHRGWVLQERLLSKRILHFLPSAVYIETKDGVTELGRKRDIRDARTPMLARPLSDDDSKMIALRSLKSLSQWFAIVEIYSRCGLTNDRDKLPAMTGIATKLQMISRDGYISGLWINGDIPSQLVWYTADGTSAKRPKPLRAPSLSWASLDGSIKYFLPLNKEEEEYRAFLKSKAPISYHRLPMTGQHLISLDKDHLINTISHRDTSEPYQIQENISLLFHGTLVDLPRLGRRSKPSNEPPHEDLWTTIDGVFDALRSVQFYRPIELGGETIGVVFLDEDSDEDVSGTKFQFVSVGAFAKLVVGLIVVEDEDNKGTLRRAGLGLLIRRFRSGTPVLESGNRRQPILFS